MMQTSMAIKRQGARTRYNLAHYFIQQSEVRCIDLENSPKKICMLTQERQ